MSMKKLHMLRATRMHHQMIVETNKPELAHMASFLWPLSKRKYIDII